MKKTFFMAICLLMVLTCHAQVDRSLDATDPVLFGGDYIVYKGQKIILGPKAFFIDGRFSDEEAGRYKYVFNSINKAAMQLTDGTEESPMVLYIAPYVYWIDNPDDPSIRIPKSGSSPFGLEITCQWLRFYGLNDKAENVVLACNRGQTLGSQGNFTMFRFTGDGTSSENITFGNYCNIDLEYPLKPELGRKKRASAIVQAQLIMCNGDKIVARNTRFVSRLNLCPFVGGKRVLFDRCHFECTDDALCATGVYLSSTFDFYSSKPFFATSGTGAVLLDCDIRSFTRGEQYFTKGGGQVAVADTRFSSENVTYIGWREVTPGDMRNYQYNVSQNGSPVQIGSRNPDLTVDMTGKQLLDAYRFSVNGKVIYNTYNLLRGNDDWDPMGIRNIVAGYEKESGKNLSSLPTQMIIAPARGMIETQKNDITLNARIFRFSNCEVKGESISWNVEGSDRSVVELQPSDDGTSCRIVPRNNNDETLTVIISARTPSGLQAASVITVSPSKLDPPSLTALPALSLTENGVLSLAYKLDTKYRDQSLVTWYRCSQANGDNAVEIAVSRQNEPMLQYQLSSGDIGYYIMASVAPKHLRSDPGDPISVVMKKPVSSGDVKSDGKVLYTDFRNMSTKNQPDVIPGFWTLTGIDSPANSQGMNQSSARDAWYYGEGTEGASGQTGLLQGRSARMLYTPVGKKFGDMKVALKVIPTKTAGQGFSIAHLYMDVLIKFDNRTMTGYALRFIRTTKYGDAVDCMFVRYENGKATEISQPVTTSCYRPSCNIVIEVKGNRLTAHADSPAEYYVIPGRPEVKTDLNLEMTISPGTDGGFGIDYNGGAATMIKELKAEWK